MIKKFIDYIAEDYNPNHQLSLFNDPNTVLDSAQQLVIHYTSPEAVAYSEIKTGRDAYDFMQFKSENEGSELMRSFVRYTCQRYSIANDLKEWVRKYFPHVTEQRYKECEHFISGKNPNGFLYLKSLGLNHLELVQKYYAKELARTVYNYNNILSSHIAKNTDKPTLTIYRAVMLSTDPAQLAADTANHPHGIGKYWSYTHRGAVAYDARSGQHATKLVRLEAEAKWTDINWGATLIKSLYNNSSEQEIELFASATPKAIAILVDNREMAVDNNTYSKMFKFKEPTPELKMKYDIVDDSQTRLVLPHPDFVSVGENPHRTYDKNYYD